jgi:ATP-binding cassette, subfamily B, bacterial
VRRLIQSARLVLGITLRAGPREFALFVVLRLVETGALPLSALALRNLANAALAGDGTGAAAWGGALGLLWMGSVVALNLGGLVGHSLLERAALLVQEKIAELAAAPVGIEHHERPDYLDRMHLLRAERHNFPAFVMALVAALAQIVQALGTALLLVRVQPLLALLPLFALPSLAAARRAYRIREQARQATAERARLGEHLFRLAITPGPAKELRIFGLTGEIAARHDTLARATAREQTRAELRAACVTAAGSLAFAAAYGGAILLVVARTLAGHATVGDVLMTLTLAAQISGQVGIGLATFGQLLQTAKTVERYGWLVEYAAAVRTPPPRDRVPVPRRLERGIALEHVSFRYTGGDRDALVDVSLDLAAGSTVALVGANGAGKSTLVKLLLRLYEPTTGRVAADGIDLRAFAADEWRARCSAAFQDFAELELPVREAIGVGDLDRLEDASAVRAALRRAQGLDVLDALPQGLETQLGRVFGGVDLSRGQWQKLALARALMRRTPLLLVLDEPTASLDALAEHRLFERYAAAARAAARSTGTVTVLVSHRFSSVTAADTIVVLDAGRIVEVGTHAQLVRSGGVYSSLYELQAEAYR